MKTKVVLRQSGQAYEPIAALGAVAVLLLLMALLLFAGPARADKVTLRPEAFVKGPAIVLGDIADIEGEQSAALSAIEIGNAAEPGTARRFNAALLASRIKTAGIDPAAVEFAGAKSVSAVTLSNELTRASLSDSLRDYILANMPWKPEEAELDVPAPLDDVVVPDGNVSIEWHVNPQYHYFGSGGFRGDVKVNGKVEHTVMMRANINAYADVLVAKSEITRGAPVRIKDFETRREMLTSLNAERVKDTSAIEGLIAKKSLFPGQTVKPSDFEAPQIIKRSQVVNVETRAGSLLIQVQAVALADARIGDLLQCSNPNSSQNFQGVVREDGTVVVP